VIGTLEEAIGKIGALPSKPSFMIHTGDISHLSKQQEFDDAERIISQAKLDVHYVPSEHDLLDEGTKYYRERYSRGRKGAGWYSFDAKGVHFIGLVNVVDLKPGGLGNLGGEQLEWLENALSHRSASAPIVVFAHIPLWAVYPEWGWDSAHALGLLKRFGSVTMLNGHIHQVMRKVEGNVAFHTAMSTAFPQPAPGTAPSPGPMKVEESKLRTLLGVTNVAFKRGKHRLATSTSLWRVDAMAIRRAAVLSLFAMALLSSGAGVVHAEEAVIVYRRRAHIINLFAAPAPTNRRPATTRTVSGFNIRRWSIEGVSLWAISDINAAELEEFSHKFEAAIQKET
jgi:Calcineurin-like phosphoesterase